MINFEQIITASTIIGKNPIVACIGSTKIISDSLGPFVGQLLTDKYQIKATVVGTLASPLHALNLTERMQEAVINNPTSKILAVDAFESPLNKDCIKILGGGIKPGLASGKDLPRIGDCSIVGHTYRYSGNSCCLSSVFALADKIAKLIDLIVKSDASDQNEKIILNQQRHF